jgi:glyoxylase-like metal-dependent hydrolase (beta-lactamase superfamily II)
MIVEQMALGPMMNFIYLVGCAETRDAAVIDPAWDVPAILQRARELDLRVRHVLLTHGHPDHINGLEELLEASDATVCVHEKEMSYMRQVAEYFGMRVDFMNRRSDSFRAVADGASVTIGRVDVSCLHTPGHTPGSQCFLAEECLFSGDTLFVNACGRVDLPGSNPEEMWRSLNQKLKALDDDVVVYPGHDYADRRTSTIGEEKRLNPFMRYASADRFLRTMRII